MTSNISRIETVFKSRLKISDSKLTSDGLLVAEGFVSESEKISPNGYRYKDSFWNTVLSQPYVKEMIANRESLGCIEHPEDDNDYMMTPYNKASHYVLSLEMRKGDNNRMCPYGKIGILNTHAGVDLKALVEAKIPVGISTRGLGTHVQDKISTYIDENDYRYITHDVVRNPNFSTLRMKNVSDSMMQSPLFKELAASLHLRDSGNTDFKRNALLRDIASISAELQSKITELSKI